MSIVYRTRKKDDTNEAMADTKSMLVVTPSTKAKKVVVMSEIRNARIKAMKRGLNDIRLLEGAVSNRLSAFKKHEQLD